MIRLPGKRKKVRLNKHTVTVIEAPPLKDMLSLKEGEERLRKILHEAR